MSAIFATTLHKSYTTTILDGKMVQVFVHLANKMIFKIPAQKVNRFRNEIRCTERALAKRPSFVIHFT